MGEKLMVSRRVCVREGNGGGATQCLVLSSTAPYCISMPWASVSQCLC